MKNTFSQVYDRDWKAFDEYFKLPKFGVDG